MARNQTGCFARLLRSNMPSKTEKQRKFMGADYARAKAGKKTKTGMSKAKLRHYAKKT